MNIIFGPMKKLFQHINSWLDFQNSLKTLTKKEKGDAFELLTKYYFKISPIYSFYENVWLYKDVPSKELEYLGLPAQDLGIDLIAKQGNDYHAIQCKYHSDKTSSVTFKEVSTFISLLESNDKISQGYICSSADLTSRNFNKLKTKPINLIMSDSWHLLEEEFFNQVRKTIDGKKVKLTPFQPRPHQKKALKDSNNYFIKEDHSRGKLIFPCGAGKSLTGFWMTQELKSKSTIIAVPSLSLVKQTLEVYLREIAAMKKRIKWLCICSDEGIGKNDDVTIFTENLGVPCQTDSTYIEQWLKDNIDEEKIIFTTYQSGRIIAEISKKLNFTFDVGIFDEAHKTVGSNKKLFSHLLFEENIFIEKRIFMTATERFYAGSRDDIISMDDENIYGDTFSKMSFKEAIESKLLTDYKVITIDVKKSEIAEFIRDNNLVQLNGRWRKESEARSLASMLALRKAMKKLPIKNAVSFHSSIEKAVRNKELQKHITESYNYKHIDTYTVSGKQSTSKRNNIVQEFADSKNALITNSRCLTEGVDVPNIDCIVFSDPKKSKVDIVQALGRALRKKKGKDWGYVILPVVYDGDTQEIDNESFIDILSIVRGLASNDERIIEYFKDKSQTKNKRLSTSNEIFSFISSHLNESDLINELEIKLWNNLSKFQWTSFEDARDFVWSLNLKNTDAWKKYCKSGNKPPLIPSNPEKVYKEFFLSFADFLGYRKGFNHKYKPYEEAIEYMSQFGLKSYKDWLKFDKSCFPPDISRTPKLIYGEEFSWQVYLGYKKHKHGQFLTLSELKNIAKDNNITNQHQWGKYSEGKELIPRGPQNVFKNNGWNGWDDFFDRKELRVFNASQEEFIKARKYIQNLKLNSFDEFREKCKLGEIPNWIPRAPYLVFKDIGWIDVDDFLGNSTISYEECKKLARELNICSSKEWKDYVRTSKRHDLKSKIERYYGAKWEGWPKFCGTDEKLSFERCKDLARSEDIKSIKEWSDFVKNCGRQDLVSRIDISKRYENDWKGHKDFFGIPNKLTYEESKKLVRELGVNSEKEWANYVRNSGRHDLVARISESNLYKDEWTNWNDFIGRPKKLTYQESKQLAQKLGIKSIKEWADYVRNSGRLDLVSSIYKSELYKDEWTNWNDFLGKSK